MNNNQSINYTDKIMEKKLDFSEVLTQGIGVGLKNLPSMIAAVVLWLVTIWIPYLNVGTTIAISTLPIELSKGKVISPLMIFDKKYYKYMGEYFLLAAFMYVAILIAMAFLVIPGIVVSIAWSMAVLLLLDKGFNPTQAISESNKITYGHKWTIFFVYFVLIVVMAVLTYIFGLIPYIGGVLNVIVLICFMVAMLGCQGVIYGKLSAGIPHQHE